MSLAELTDHQRRLAADREHLLRPEVGDYWHEMFCPYFVVVDVREDAILVCQDQKDVDSDGWTWDTARVTRLTREEFRRRLCYAGRAPDAGTVASVSPRTHAWAAVAARADNPGAFAVSLDVYLEIEVDTGGDSPHTAELFTANITGNATDMAAAAGLYEPIWRPEEVGIATAAQLAGPLREGLALMASNPRRFKKLNPANDWSLYDSFVPWLQRYLEACELHPKATVRACR